MRMERNDHVTVDRLDIDRDIYIHCTRVNFIALSSLHLCYFICVSLY